MLRQQVGLGLLVQPVELPVQRVGLLVQFVGVLLRGGLRFGWLVGFPAQALHVVLRFLLKQVRHVLRQHPHVVLLDLRELRFLGQQSEVAASSCRRDCKSGPMTPTNRYGYPKGVMSTR